MSCSNEDVLAPYGEIIIIVHLVNLEMHMSERSTVILNWPQAPYLLVFISWKLQRTYHDSMSPFLSN